MNLDEFKSLSNDPDLIPGIYNYCDRWCERCHLSSRCLNFKMEMHATKNQTKNDLTNKEFWDELSQTFALTMEMLREIAEEQGLDFEKIKNQSKKVNPQDDTKVQNHPLNILAKKYHTTIKLWLKTNADVFIKQANTYNKLAAQGVINVENTNDLIVFRDLYEIVSWYHSMIFVKMKRAVMSLLSDEHENEIQNDANGSAKVVLTCIDRSMFAWNGILNKLPQLEDDALRHLAMLQNLKEEILQYFPKAEKFIRPGFDESDI